MELTPQPNRYGKRRHYSPEFKQQLVLQVLKDDVNVAKLALQNNINNNQLFRWCREYEHSSARWVKLANNTLVPKTTKVAAKSTLIPVKVAPSTNLPPPSNTTEHPVLTITHVKGHQITLHQSDTNLVKQVLALLL